MEEWILYSSQSAVIGWFGVFANLYYLPSAYNIMRYAMMTDGFCWLVLHPARSWLYPLIHGSNFRLHAPFGFVSTRH